MNMTRGLLLLVTLLSCSSSADSGDGGSGLMPAAGQLGLRVNQTSVVKVRDMADGPWTRTNVYISLTLANGAGAPDVPASVALFSVKTDTGLGKIPTTDDVFQIDGTTYRAATYLVDPPCDSTLTLSAGASLTCSLAVSFDGDVGAKEILYRTPGALALANGVPGAADVRSVTTTLSASPCVPCGRLCTDTSSDATHCGSCQATAPAGGVCAKGMGVCPSDHPDLCGVQPHAACTTLAGNPSNCGTCGNAIPPDADCTGGKPTCKTTGATFCPGQMGAPGVCANLAQDDRNCGACGHLVGSGTCSNGMLNCNANATLCTDSCITEDSKLNCGSCTNRCERAASDNCYHVDGNPTCGTQIACASLMGINYDEGCKMLGYKGCVLKSPASCLSQGSTCYCAY